MTEMELLNGEDDNTTIITNHAVPIAGKYKIVPLNDDVSDFSELRLVEKNDDDGGGFFGESVVVVKSTRIEVDESEESPAVEKLDGEFENEKLAVGEKIEADEMTTVISPNSKLPKPEAPAGIVFSRSQSAPESGVGVNMPAIGKFFREKSSSLSSSITKGLSTLKDESERFRLSKVTEFNLSGVKVIVKTKNEDDEVDKVEFKGQISFFSRSNCRDCSAVRHFLRERNLRYVEINIDVFPGREKELIERAGSASVPQIFFNEKLVGGLVVLNSLRNSGMLEQKLKDLLSRKCPASAPAPPVYGFDDQSEEDERMDEMVGIVRVLRQKLPIQDRMMKMKIVKNCFSGSEIVDAIMKHYEVSDRIKAVEIGNKLVQKHFIHNVFGEIEFEDGNHYYRFLEHETFIPRCFNFRGSTNDIEPKAAPMVSQRLSKLMSAILESYASDDRQHLDYVAISNSEEFRRYVNLVQDLQRLNIMALSPDEKLAFFLNLFNAMVIHAAIRIGHPGGVVDRRSFNSDFLYIIGGHHYSLNDIRNGILRANRRAPYSLVKPFGGGDRRLEMALPKMNPLIHFGLCNGTRSSPTVRFFTPKAIESELRHAAREFFQKDGIEVNLAKRTVYLTRIIKWFDMDFGQEKEMLRWIMKYLDATKAGLLTHLLADGGSVNVVYQKYDWSSNF